jgi:ketosteroid isomerase-like protein
MKNWVFIFLLVSTTQLTAQKTEINTMLNTWHKSAAVADFDAYFSYMAKDGIFIGTDATENWQLDAFKAFSKPYFDKGKAWSFTAIKRNIYIDKSKKIAWFDELLDTHMALCRGSGVLKKIKGKWKIVHYVLSITVPNDDMDKVIEIKKEAENALKEKLKNKQ